MSIFLTKEQVAALRELKGWSFRKLSRHMDGKRHFAFLQKVEVGTKGMSEETNQLLLEAFAITSKEQLDDLMKYHERMKREEVVQNGDQ